MNSILTAEERTLLRSLGCCDKAEALEMLHGIDMGIPAVVSLLDKLEHDLVDYVAEMQSDDIFDIDDE